jgi:hypothetical protein
MVKTNGYSTIFRTAVLSCVVAVALSLQGCATIGDFIVKVFEKIGGTPTDHVRISGMNHFLLDKKDARDGNDIHDGYMCVVHDPGCGVIGNDGVDRFFSEEKALPLLAKIEKVEYEPFWPDGLGKGTGGGVGPGSYGQGMNGWPSSGPQPVLIDWNNTCTNSYGGRKIYYSVSFIVSVPRGTDLGEPGFDPALQPETACKLDGYHREGEEPNSPIPPSVQPSGFSGVVKICNITTNVAKGTLHLEGSVATPLSGAEGATMMKEDIPVQFPPGGSGGAESPFKTQLIYKQGTWTITNAKVIGLTGALPALPLTLQLPGGVGSPVLDFTGGRCPL